MTKRSLVARVSGSRSFSNRRSCDVMACGFLGLPFGLPDSPFFQDIVSPLFSRFVSYYTAPINHESAYTELD